MALAMMPQCGGRLADALVTLGILRPAELSRLVRQQARSRFLEAFRWEQGAWCYVRGPVSQEETFGVHEDPFEVMPVAAGEVPLRVVQSTLGGMGQRSVCATHSAPALSGAYRMPQAWARVLEGSLRGAKPVPEWIGSAADEAGVETSDAQRALYFGLSCELLRVA